MLRGYGGYTSRLALFLLQYLFPLVMIDIVFYFSSNFCSLRFVYISIYINFYFIYCKVGVCFCLSLMSMVGFHCKGALFSLKS